MSSSGNLISVVMPVYNALPHLDAAVRSILDQTFRDFEFVIYDDGSTDGSAERLRDWAARDSRIRLFEGKHNLGPAGSSAVVVEKATAPLIARMDADDLSSHDRLARQLELIRDRPEVGVVGSLFEVIDDRGRVIRGPEIWRLERRAPFVPFAHGSMLFRRSAFDRVGGYRREAEFWEDQDLVLRMAAVAEVLVIPSPLYQLRQWSSNTRAASDQERVENAVDLMYRSVTRLAHGRSYEDLLGSPTKPARVDPRVFISAGSLVLWSGGRPRFFGRLLKRGKLGPNFRTLSALVWTAWASLSPSSLRGFMSLLVRTRNGFAGRKVSTSAPQRWSPPAVIQPPR
jgi:glycosyltransferase involved in cell wall biosynthesis